MLLSVVGGEHGYLFGRVAKESHVHEGCHHKLCLCQVLVEERRWLRLAHPVEIFDVDQLVVVGETAVGGDVDVSVEDVWQIAQDPVSPVVQRTDGGQVRSLTNLWYLIIIT